MAHSLSIGSQGLSSPHCKVSAPWDGELIDPGDEVVNIMFLAGRSMGARVAAEVASNSSLTANFVYGVACLCYPLHPPRKTSELRVSPLLHLGVPVLFISGRKDPFCRTDLMETTLERMANDWKMHWVEGADHELKIHNKVNNDVISNMCEWFVQWCQSVFMAER